jgi:hypothetical protein
VTAISSTPPQLSTLVETLLDTYGPAATRQAVTLCVAGAWDAVRFVGATEEDDITVLAGRIAERDLRLRLGLDREAARLDPETHTPR